MPNGADSRSRSAWNNFIRGAELWMHAARMGTQALLMILIAGLVVWATGVVLYLTAVQDPGDWYLLLKYLQAWFFDSVGLAKGIVVVVIDGRELRAPPSVVIELLLPHREKFGRNLYNANLVGGLAALGLMGLAWGYWREFGRRKMEDEQVRGVGIITPQAARTHLRQTGRLGDLVLAGVPLPRGAEIKHLGLFGATGAGKTVAQLALLDQIRARQQPAIVYDPTGEFVQHFYRDGVDVLLNPLDARSPVWSPFAEIRAGYDFAAIAGSLYPVRHDDPDKFWSQSAQRVFEEVLRSLAKQGRRTNATLYQALALSDLSDLSRLLKGTPAAKYTSESVERTAIDIQMTVQNATASFRYLHDEGTPFSIRDWVAKPGDRWLFLTSHERQAEVLRPLISLWVGAAVDAIMDRPPTHALALWLILDELPSLNYLRSLEGAMTRARKYGLACVIGVQQFSQLKKIYGVHDAQTLLSMCQTKLVLRVTDPDAAQYLARLIGQEEKDEKEETLSYGINEQRDGVSVFARRQIRDLVLPAEIMKLEDLEGYLLVPGSLPAVRVRYGRMNREVLTPGFVPRAGSDAMESAPSGSDDAPTKPAPIQGALAFDEDAAVPNPSIRVPPIQPRSTTAARDVQRIEERGERQPGRAPGRWRSPG